MIPKGFRAYGKPERVQEGDPSAWMTVRDVQTGKTTRTYTGATVSSVGLPQGFHYYGQGSSTPKANASDLPKGFRYYNANGSANDANESASKAHAASKPSAPGCGSCAVDPSLGDLAREIAPTMRRLAAQAKKAESKGVDPWGKGYRPYKG